MSKKNEIKKTLDTQVDFWNIQLEEVLGTLHDINHITENQTLILSHRHRVIKDIRKIQLNINDIQSSLYLKNKETLDTLKTKSNIAYNSYSEFDIAVKSKLKLIYEVLDLFKAHLEYLNDVKTTLDKMGFAIKNRIDLFNNSAI